MVSLSIGGLLSASLPTVLQALHLSASRHLLPSASQSIVLLSASIMSLSIGGLLSVSLPTVLQALHLSASRHLLPSASQSIILLSASMAIVPLPVSLNAILQAVHLPANLLIGVLRLSVGLRAILQALHRSASPLIGVLLSVGLPAILQALHHSASLSNGVLLLLASPLIGVLLLSVRSAVFQALHLSASLAISFHPHLLSLSQVPVRAMVALQPRRLSSVNNIQLPIPLHPLWIYLASSEGFLVLKHWHPNFLLNLVSSQVLHLWFTRPQTLEKIC